MLEKSEKCDLDLILNNWELDEKLSVSEEIISYETNRETHIWNVCNKYILKMTNDECEMKNNINITKLLLKEEIPVQKVIQTLSGESYIYIDKMYFGLFTRLNGSVIKDYFQGDYLKRAFYLGECAANLHKGLKVLTEEKTLEDKIWNNNMIDELNGWVKDEVNKYLKSSSLNKEEVELFNKIRKEFNENFESLYLKLPRQIIHRDFHGENMIFEGEKLIGYIDFDLTQINAKIFDLCYLCTGALSTCFNNSNKRDRWIKFSKTAIEGYDNKINLTCEEKECIKYMLLAIELIMIGYFAKDGYKDIADANVKMFNFIDSVWDM